MALQLSQMDMFIENQQAISDIERLRWEVQALRKEIEAVWKGQRGLFARYNEVEHDVLEIRKKIEREEEKNDQ